jgi:DNA-binding MarR family transcriptional regulator
MQKPVAKLRGKTAIRGWTAIGLRCESALWQRVTLAGKDCSMIVAINPARLEQSRRDAVKSRSMPDRHDYFHAVAQARHILRKVFRLVENEAMKAGIDPIAHQALIQIYGSKESTLRVKDVAQRLDISPAFTSSLIKQLLEKGLVKRQKVPSDKRSAWLTITTAGKTLLCNIDDQVQIHVEYFTRAISPQERQAAVSILLFYAGISLQRCAGHS